MSKDNKTEQMLIDNLHEDFAWRIKELSIIKSKIPSQQNEEQHALIRAGITLLYAHWEGFIKNAAENYLNFVSLKGLNHNQLQSCFVALCFKKQINELKTNKFELQQTLVDFMLNELNKRAYIPYEGIIDTKSNLKFWVFRDICIIIGVDYKKYQLKEKKIDADLVERRNKIAHGKYLLVDYDGYTDIYNIVVKMMEDMKNDILDAAMNEKYRKN
ncbi:MAE_28990/MAE_18760 family HEPN-like nuclease [Aphanizomenon sp. CS-733/32]|uniref:MAE_28990/MAE_18760 family HEPN-like nuclease n=1 Tax=Aphanizomenon sp. CS-733/32 TaxID=3021715 RepID=UPI00232CB7A6|nr:MAE_28990/MAE_18760 family HEPN-like nuclease [Aphanizomenon sp. CS-733/32]MDB9308957.1 MAE_28990/MAE_18760 family HEPN-like nuclease [Aphanizomenon sp. CS-733/32]